MQETFTPSIIFLEFPLAVKRAFLVVRVVDIKLIKLKVFLVLTSSTVLFLQRLPSS